MITEEKIINSRIGIVANDAGGSNYIYSFIINHSISPFLFCSGPEVDIFKLVSNAKVTSSIDEIISKVDILIFSSGSPSGFEINALKYSKDKVLTLSLLDHWTNYLTRFKIKNEIILPDALIVFDKYAYDAAKQQFPKNTNILLFDNYYMQNQIIESNKFERKNDYILYIDEPIKNHPNTLMNYNYDEFFAFKLFLKLKSKTKYKDDNIMIRLHPSVSNQNKYSEFINADQNIYISKNNTLAHDIVKSKIVVGFESMALAVALELKKPVFSIIPNNGKRSSLPFNEIKLFYNEV